MASSPGAPQVTVDQAWRSLRKLGADQLPVSIRWLTSLTRASFNLRKNRLTVRASIGALMRPNSSSYLIVSHGERDGYYRKRETPLPKAVLRCREDS